MKISDKSDSFDDKDAVLKALASRGVCTAEATSKSSNTFPYTKYLIALCCYEPGAPLSSCPPGDGCCRRPPKGAPAHEIFLHLELPNTREYEDDMGGWVDKCWEELTSGLTLLGIL
ncbi:hypothetical protein TrCOL_g13294 [Triparma columacea]|uniref:Uncharacterized protein n=1 Tax=Triparma columacea TaxID=722753 RepID=A0A9W7GCW3_9STRA|nr:hypothetical protein TrCOL_g13294 [Triparma columacea]